METTELFYLFRNIAFFFASLMLIKYTIYLLVAPFYTVKETIRDLNSKRRKRDGIYIQYKISVIIPAHNEEVGIVKTVRSIVNNTYHNKEIIIINDGSTDNTDGVLRGYIDAVTTKDYRVKDSIKYWVKEKGGKGTALNFGLEKASGDIILTVDADSVLKKDALRNLNSYFNDQDISAVVGNVIIANPHTLIGFIQYLEYEFGFYFKRALAFMGAEYIFGGACAAFRKSVLDEVGNFSTTSKTEDIEMSMRIRAYGHKCTYAEDVICYTEGPLSIVDLINQRLRWKKGRIDAFWKHRNLFFSLHQKHNKLLTFFVLPFSILSEIQLLFEPISIALLVAYSYISNDYLTLFLGILFILIIYLVNSLFTAKGIRPKIAFLFPLTWPFFYILVWIEYIALLQSIRLTLSGHDIEWQKWKRQGVPI